MSERYPVRKISKASALAEPEVRSVNSAAQSPVLYGKLVTVSGTGPETALVVSHGLSRIPRTWMLCAQRGDVFAQPRQTSANDRTITLAIAQIGDFEFDIWVF